MPSNAGQARLDDAFGGALGEQVPTWDRRVQASSAMCGAEAEGMPPYRLHRPQPRLRQSSLPAL